MKDAPSKKKMKPLEDRHIISRIETMEEFVNVPRNSDVLLRLKNLEDRIMELEEGGVFSDAPLEKKIKDLKNVLKKK
jgi:hypothetical protein